MRNFSICLALTIGVATAAAGAGPVPHSEDDNIYTDGTCIKSGISGLSASKSGCDSIGGVWRSKRSERIIDAEAARWDRNAKSLGPGAAKH